MTTQLASLERALEQLANQFATDLIRATLRTRISELEPLLEERLLAPAAFPVAEAVSPARSPAPHRSQVSTPASPNPPASSSPSSQASRGRFAPRPRGAASNRTRVIDADDADMLANAITDPSLLLDVIASGVTSTPRPSRSRAMVDGGSGLLESRDSRETATVTGEQGPTLRPGERLQRTASGNVVLRRDRS